MDKFLAMQLLEITKRNNKLLMSSKIEEKEKRKKKNGKLCVNGWKKSVK